MKISLRTILLAVAIIAALAPLGASANPGDLYATDNVSVRKFTPSGTGTVFSSGVLRPRGLSFDKFANLFGSTLDTSSLFDNQGRIVQYAANGTATTFASGPNGPEQTAFDSAGNLYTGTGTVGLGIIYKVTPEGIVTAFAMLPNPNPNTQIFGLVVARDQQIFVADPGEQKVYKIARNGAVTLFATVAPTANSGPIGLALDEAQNLFVSTSGDIGEIIKISSNGTQTVFATIPTDTDLRGIIFDEQGNLFVAGHGSNNIYKVLPNGTVTVFASGLAVPQFFAIEPPFPPASPPAPTPPHPTPPPHNEP